MVKKDILPSALKYRMDLAKMIKLTSEIYVGASEADTELLGMLSMLTDKIYAAAERLEKIVANAKTVSGEQDLAYYYRANVLPAMHALRSEADELETYMAKDYLPYPSYGDLIYDV